MDKTVEPVATIPSNVGAGQYTMSVYRSLDGAFVVQDDTQLFIKADQLPALISALQAALPDGGWLPIESAPKGEDVLVWYDHGADPYCDPQNPKRLTDYAAWADGGDFLDHSGVTVARHWPQHWESTDEYGDGYWLPAAWFSRGDFGGYEVVCNPVRWQPLPPPPPTVSKGDGA